MRPHYVKFQNVRVSGRWNTVLRQADKTIDFKVNSGHRTMGQQKALFQQNMRFNGVRWVARPGRPLTAFPSPLAPHVRLGRAAHALDVDQFAGDGVARLAKWLRNRKVSVKFPVPGEPWHLEISGRDLKRLWRRYR